MKKILRFFGRLIMLLTRVMQVQGHGGALPGAAAGETGESGQTACGCAERTIPASGGEAMQEDKGGLVSATKRGKKSVRQRTDSK